MSLAVLVARAYAEALRRACAAGLVGAALVDREGATIARFGELPAAHACALTAQVLHEHASADLNDQLFAGERLEAMIDGFLVELAVVRRTLFVITVRVGRTPPTNAAVADLWLEVSQMLEANGDRVTPTVDNANDGGAAPAATTNARLRLAN